MQIILLIIFYGVISDSGNSFSLRFKRNPPYSLGTLKVHTEKGELSNLPRRKELQINFSDLSSVCSSAEINDNEEGQYYCTSKSVRDTSVNKEMVPKVIDLHDQKQLRETGLLQDYVMFYRASETLTIRMEDAFSGYVAACCRFEREFKKCVPSELPAQRDKRCGREKRLFLEYFRDMKETRKDALELYDLSHPENNPENKAGKGIKYKVKEQKEKSLPIGSNRYLSLSKGNSKGKPKFDFGVKKEEKMKNSKVNSINNSL